MARMQYVRQEALLGLRRNMLMTVAVILSVAVSLTLLGAFLLLNRQVNLVSGEWYGKIEVSIYLCDTSICGYDITPEQQDNLRQALEDDPLVETVFYESKEEAWRNFQEMFANQPEFTENVPPDAIPASFRVKLFDPEQYSTIDQRFESWPGVNEVADNELLEQLFALTDMMKYFAALVAGVQLVAACVLIANTIRVGAFARREQTAIMKLVGAANWYIRLPFVLEGSLAGLVGAVLASGILLALVTPVTTYVGRVLQFMPFIDTGDALVVSPILLVAGAAVAALSSFLALHRFLDV